MQTTVRQMAEWVSGELVGDGDVAINAARPLSEAGPGDITFVEGEKNLAAWHACRASAAVVPSAVPLNGRPLIRVADPLTAFATIVLQLRGLRTSDPAGRIDPTAHVHPTARVGPGCSVGPFAVVGERTVLGARCRIHAGAVVGRDCQLGDDVVLYPHAVVYDDCTLGHRVVVHANAVIGADGFGFRTQNGRHVKVPQLGRVELGDDVEVGACTTIDRATLGETVIGRGTKIDNLVQVAHNVKVGPLSLLVAQCGISGSTELGQGVILAGQVGIVGHLKLGDGARVGAQSGVSRDLAEGETVSGSPAIDHREWLRMSATLPKVADLIRQVRKLEKRVEELERK